MSCCLNRQQAKSLSVQSCMFSKYLHQFPFSVQKHGCFGGLETLNCDCEWMVCVWNITLDIIPVHCYIPCLDPRNPGSPLKYLDKIIDGWTYLSYNHKKNAVILYILQITKG